MSAPVERRLIDESRRLRRQLSAATAGRLSIVTTVDASTHVWAQRAAALAFYGQSGIWSTAPLPPVAWANAAAVPSLTALQHQPSDCPICLEPYSDALPTQADDSRSRPGLAHT